MPKLYSNTSLPGLNAKLCFGFITNVLLFFLSANFVFAQNETNKWYFGKNAAIDFMSGSPVSMSGCAISTDEGSASVSDGAGNLLFYTDGVTVLNKNNVTMTNGSGLLGGFSSTQSGLIVKQPQSDSIYYIFTTSQQLAFGGLDYSIVDMSLQGGLGEVITKNVLLDAVSTEKITAICHSNDTDIWVIAHDWNNNQFQSYLLTSTGIITTPVISSVGTIAQGSSGNVIGYLKGSPTGNHLAQAVWVDNYFELFDFDKTSGMVSHPLHLVGSTAVSSGAYGVEFSPDGNLLYGTEITPGYIYQWNLAAGSDSLIIASKTLIGTSAVNFNGALQLASDQKIYMAEYGSAWLGAINDPNVQGVGCNYDDTGFQLSYGYNGLGLPNIFPCLFKSSMMPQANFNSSDSATCLNTCLDFYDLSINNPTSWQWSFPGGNPSSSSLQNPSNICYNTSGTYDVTLIVTNSAGSDTIAMSNFISVNAAPTANITQSNDTLYSSAGSSYQWYTGGNAINGATDDFYVPSTEDYYTVVITDANGCTAADTIFFSLSPQTSFAASDTTICQKFCMDFFDQSGNNPITWKWSFPGGVPSSSNQQNPTQICYNNPGVYDVTLITTNSFGSDTLILTGYITVYSTPAFPTITVTGDILTSSYASSYQWQFNSADIPGATNQSYTATQTGYYTVVITDENGCVSSTTVFVEVTGLSHIDDGFGFSIYPNPSNGNFVIELPMSLANEYICIGVVNALGQRLQFSHEKISSGNFKIKMRLNGITAGVYFVEITSESYFTKKKLIIYNQD